MLFDEIKYRRDKDRDRGVYGRKGDQWYLISVWYDLGGYSYFTYKHEPRGYFLSVRPVELTLNPDTGDVMFYAYTVFVGIKKLLEEATRFNKRRLQEFADEHIANVQIDKLVEELANHQGVTRNE